eukprot:TRINITY_DN20950_c0_g1_i1.p2 TRINITY_DN20950_c0_g1~~TRINITY_DN20950_c0_g1_i1.p2  ORF type:complete len:127 (-),score=4.89 TRINITY_DN20950_c0_g1_i1:465-845(-)
MTVISSNTPMRASELAQVRTDSRNCEISGPSDDFFLRLCFAMAFSGICVGLFTYLGLIKSATVCNESTSYATCCIWQDLRSILSFLVAALLCWHVHLTNGEDCVAVGSSGTTSEGVSSMSLWNLMS